MKMEQAMPAMADLNTVCGGLGGEDYTTGNASLDDPRNQDGIGEDELLAVSFGTSFNDSRRLTIGAIECALEHAFPGWSVRRAFTSRTIIDRIRRRDGVSIDSVEQALERAAENGVKRLVIQPTHLMNGLEYHDVAAAVAQFAGAFEAVSVGAPLLDSEEDFRVVAGVLAEAAARYGDKRTAVCFMGHGTEAASNAVYARMQRVMAGAGCANCFIGTVEASPGLEEVLAMVKAGDYDRVVLQPMMIVAGDHANHDMAGDGEDAWKTAFAREGYSVECVLKGLGEYQSIQELLVSHARAAVDKLG